MAETDKNPKWVTELNAYLEEFKEKYPEAKVNILAGDGRGYMCVIDDLDVWAGGLFNVLLDTPMLMLPTTDAIQQAFKKMNETVNESKTGDSPQPIVIRPNQIKS